MKNALLIIAVLLFLLAAFNITLTTHVLLLPLGLACFAASFLPWKF